MVISDILSHLIELTANVSNAFTAVLFRLDADGGALVAREHLSLTKTFRPGTRLPLGEGPIGKAAATGQPVLIDHFDPSSTPLGIYDKEENLKSVLVTPVVNDRLEGVLLVASKEAYSFSTKLQKIISGFADQMAWHLKQEQGLPGDKGGIWPSVHKMNVFGRLIAEAPDREAIAQRLVQTPPSVLRCDAIAVIWFDQRGEVGKVQGQRGFVRELSRMEVIPGKGLPGSAAKKKSSVLTRLMGRSEAVVFSERETFASLAAVPISVGEKLLGVLVCGSKNPEGLSNPDLEKLSLLASTAASLRDKPGPVSQGEKLDVVTGLPNRHFLREHSDSIGEKLHEARGPVVFLSTRVANLSRVRTTFGKPTVEALLRQMAAGFSKVMPSPKYLFKVAEDAFLIILLNRERAEVLSLETKLSNLFENKPIFVHGNAIRIKAEWGMAAYGEDGRDLLELADMALARQREALLSST
jgi:GGDEF domain-containing protein